MAPPVTPNPQRFLIRSGCESVAAPSAQHINGMQDAGSIALVEEPCSRTLALDSLMDRV